MSLGELCDLAARENIRLRWKCRLNSKRTLYRVELIADCAEHIGQHWVQPFPLTTPLPAALDAFAATVLAFYLERLEHRRAA